MDIAEMWGAYCEGKRIYISNRRIVHCKMLHHAGFVLLTKDENGRPNWYDGTESVEGYVGGLIGDGELESP